MSWFASLSKSVFPLPILMASAFFGRATLFAQSPAITKPYLDLTFAGDIMAHTRVVECDDYGMIYSDIEYIIKNDDFSFANFESPVVDGLPYETYPNFNSRNEYARAPITAGFDLFCLANNHTNDQHTRGVEDTWTFYKDEYERGSIAGFSGLQDEKPVSFEALREAADSSPLADGVYTVDTGVGALSFSVVTKNGWRLLFLAYTEFLNDYYKMERTNYVPRTKKNATELPRVLAELRLLCKPDIFVLGVHTDDPEYVRTVTETRRSHFDALLNAGVDIIWANHPHVTQEWDVLLDAADGRPKKLVMYSVGNLISGQRWNYGFADPSGQREWTGDCVMMEVSAVRTRDGLRFDQIHPVFCTTHKQAPKNYVIRRYTTAFMETQEEPYRAYYRARFKELEQTKENRRIYDD